MQVTIYYYDNDNAARREKIIDVDGPVSPLRLRRLAEEWFWSNTTASCGYEIMTMQNHPVLET